MVVPPKIRSFNYSLSGEFPSRKHISQLAPPHPTGFILLDNKRKFLGKRSYRSHHTPKAGRAELSFPASRCERERTRSPLAPERRCLAAGCVSNPFDPHICMRGESLVFISSLNVYSCYSQTGPRCSPLKRRERFRANRETIVEAQIQ